VKKVVNLVDGGSGTDIATAFESSSLKGIADGPGEDTWDDFETHHGDNWMSAIITDATSAVSSYSTAGAKAEAIEKTLMDSIAMQSIITDWSTPPHRAQPHYRPEECLLGLRRGQVLRHRRRSQLHHLRSCQQARCQLRPDDGLRLDRLLRD